MTRRSRICGSPGGVIPRDDPAKMNQEPHLHGKGWIADSIECMMNSERR